MLLERMEEWREMKVHELKIAPQYFSPLVDGKKTFEIRKNDRGYEVGDMLHLKEFKEGLYTGKTTLVEVTYITDAYQKDGYIVMAIKEAHF